MGEEKKELQEIDRVVYKYEVPNDYEPKFATGAWGVTSNDGVLTINFFHDLAPIPSETIYDVKKGVRGKILSPEPIENEAVINRRVVAGVTLNFTTAKQVYSWMGDRIAEFESAIGEAKKKDDDAE